jgi:hypothetical protein
VGWGLYMKAFWLVGLVLDRAEVRRARGP